MKYSRSVHYALKATLLLSEMEESDPVPCSYLAKLGQMPDRFLLQVLRQLVNHGILRSTRGVEGGYQLNRPLHEITFLDVVDAVDRRDTLNESQLEGLPDASQAKLQSALTEAAAASRRQLAAVTLASLLPPPEMSDSE